MNMPKELQVHFALRNGIGCEMAPEELAEYYQGLENYTHGSLAGEHLGVFWHSVDIPVLFPLAQLMITVEIINGIRTMRARHDEYWEQLYITGELYNELKRLNYLNIQDYCDDYTLIPRGRISYNTQKSKYVLLVGEDNRSILKDNKVCEFFNIPQNKFIVETTEFYNVGIKH